MKRPLNALTIRIYERYSTTLVADPGNWLEGATIESFSSVFPGGLYANASIYVPMKITSPYLWKIGNRVTIQNGLAIVWEGELTFIGRHVGQGTEQGVSLECAGSWGTLLDKRTWDKRWADTRLDEAIWRWDTSATATARDIISLDRDVRLRLTPNNEQFNQDVLAALTYTMPTGETIKRVTLNRALQEVFLTQPKCVLTATDGFVPAGKVKHFDEPSTYVDMDNTIDGNTGTSDTVTLSADDRLYIGFNKPFYRVRFDLGATINATATSVGMQAWDGSAWTEVTNLQDNTNSSGTFRVDGTMVYAVDTWVETEVDGYTAFWVRVDPALTLTAVQFLEIEIEDFASATFTDLTNTYDGYTTTTSTISFNASHRMYIKVRDEINCGFLRFDFGGTVNANGSTLSAEYWRGEYVTPGGIDAVAQWVPITITDGTDSAGATFAQDGDVTFVTPGDWAEVTVDNKRGLWLRLSVLYTLTSNVVINEIWTGKTQTWELRLRDRTGAANIWTVTASGTGSQDDTLGTPRQALSLEYLPRVQQIGESNGTVYGQISAPVVYSETGDITLTEIAKDCRAEVTELNSDEGYIATNALSLVPFFTVGPETIASILARAAAYGDGSYNSWYVRLLGSDKASVPDGKPVLEVAQYPVLTDYDYAVRFAEVDGGVDIVQDGSGVINWVSLIYQDEENNREIIITPDDDANLKDTTSITTYGERHLPQPFNVGVSTSANAISIGRKILAKLKDPLYLVTSPIVVKDFIRTKGGGIVPACEIQAGKRIKGEDFLEDLAGVSGAGLTMIINATTYNDQAKTCSISLGQLPDSLALYFAQMELNQRPKGVRTPTR